MQNNTPANSNFFTNLIDIPMYELSQSQSFNVPMYSTQPNASLPVNNHRIFPINNRIMPVNNNNTNLPVNNNNTNLPVNNNNTNLPVNNNNDSQSKSTSKRTPNPKPKVLYPKTNRLKWDEETIIRFLEIIQKTQNLTNGGIKWRDVLLELQKYQKRLIFLDAENKKDVEKLKRKFNELRQAYYKKLADYKSKGIISSEQVWETWEKFVQMIEDKKLKVTTREMINTEQFEKKRKEEAEQKRNSKRAKFETITNHQQKELKASTDLLTHLKSQSHIDNQSSMNFNMAIDKIAKVMMLSILSQNPNVYPYIDKIFNSGQSEIINNIPPQIPENHDVSNSLIDEPSQSNTLTIIDDDVKDDSRSKIDDLLNGDMDSINDSYNGDYDDYYDDDDDKYN